jgi:glutaminyl-peptide cyclotransferase
MEAWHLFPLQICLTALAAVGLIGCVPTQTNTPTAHPASLWLEESDLNQTHAWQQLHAFLEHSPRNATTPGAQQAAEHIAGQLRAMDIPAVIDSFEAPTPIGTGPFHNVYAHIPGRSDKSIILLSHIDTKSGISPHFTGANDSGSSTALLLELARLANASKPLAMPLLFAFLDGEECMIRYSDHDGLHGSKHLVRKLEREGRLNSVRAVILLDMIGDADLTVGIPRNGDPTLTRLALQAARQTGHRRYFSLGRQAILDDHVPFLEAGIPAINLIDFQYGSRPGANDYWHTPEDTAAHLSPESLKIVGQVTVRLINLLFLEETQ